MSLRIAATIASTIAGLGTAAAGSTAIATPSVTTAAAQPASQPATPPTCDDGPWTLGDGVNVQGRPDHFDTGDRGATYIWHDSDGWHLRAADVRRVENDYSGTIAVSAGAYFSGLHPVRLEKDDQLYVDGDNVLHYRFSTYNGIDGFDFRVSACGGDRSHERLSFHLSRNGSDDSLARIDLGDRKAHPDSNPFSAVRNA